VFFGFTFEKLIVIAAIAALVVGPERLPKYAESLARLTKRAREMLQGAKTRMQDEMGEDFDDVDWRKLDPRQYDPRRIIREALLDDAPLPASSPASAASIAAATPDTGRSSTDAGAAARTSFTPGEAPPFDPEAT
jgi:sec-independent protein translocase protein TatB